jgi:tetratricopeptide (TPR) repeat protein
MPGNKKLFLSAVSNEFNSYRKLLASDLMRPNLDVAVQEDFVVTGGKTLEKLDIYIIHCDAVIHLVGKATGGAPEEPAVAALLAKYPDLGTRLPPLAEHLRKPQPGFSYTQWEAYLALYHRRPLFVYRPTDFALDALDVPRDARFVFHLAEAQSQKEHYQRISALGHDRGQFLNEERLSSAVLRDLVEILPRLESATRVSPTRLRHTAERLIGREDDLTRLDAAWNDPHKNVVVVRAWGGVGKTSLVATWMAELALKNWRGAERVFDWSFYSQGTGEQGLAAADTFLADALRTFSDPDPTLGSPWDRGARLARLVGQSRCLLVLDGLEPLQYPPGPMEGKLKHQGIEALLKGLAAQNAGLCVVTTREKVDDIKQHYGRTADDLELSHLTDLAGASLLHYAGARRAGAKALAPDDKELQAASREVRGHGLTLQLLGRYLGLAEDGDILKRDTVRLADADREYQNDATRPYGHAFKAMEAYQKWFAGAGEQGQRQLTILRLLGLFERSASRHCLDALRAKPVIAGLTEAFVGLTQRDWKLALSRLEEINLLAVQADGSVDCHPLLREYFGGQLRQEQPQAWRIAHKRLYEHLCAITKDKPHPTLEDLQPLYQAVAHGCQAGLQQEADHKVYQQRILRGNEDYSFHKLGALGSNLGAVACFFETTWSCVSPVLSEPDQAWLLNQAAQTLRAFGRLTEALDPMRAGLEMRIKQKDWHNAARIANNLSELELTVGEMAGAVGDAEQSVTYADRSGNTFDGMASRATHGDALHQAGRRSEAEALFREAETIQVERQPTQPALYSLAGFRYCELLLKEAERAAWQHCFSLNPQGATLNGLESCRTVQQRAAQTLKIAELNNWLLHIALDHLTLGRTALYAAILEGTAGCPQPASPPRGEDAAPHLAPARRELDAAVGGLRRANRSDYLPRALLTRAWLRSLTGARIGPESAQSDLDEAWEIAERGPMPLFLADIHLHRARLFGKQKVESRKQKSEETAYPWESPQADLAEARRLIYKHGYMRRKKELEDAEQALGG